MLSRCTVTPDITETETELGVATKKIFHQQMKILV